MLWIVVAAVVAFIAGVLVGRRHPAEASVLAAVADRAKQKVENVVSQTKPAA
jgi:hypothetical protein